MKATFLTFQIKFRCAKKLLIQSIGLALRFSQIFHFSCFCFSFQLTFSCCAIAKFQELQAQIFRNTLCCYFGLVIFFLQHTGKCLETKFHFLTQNKLAKENRHTSNSTVCCWFNKLLQTTERTNAIVSNLFCSFFYFAFLTTLSVLKATQVSNHVALLNKKHSTVKRLQCLKMAIERNFCKHDFLFHFTLFL